MKKALLGSVLALASSLCFAQQPTGSGQTSAQPGGQQQGITIADPAEYNAYSNAISQSTPAAKAAAMEAFLSTYPQSQAKADVLQRLLATYQQTGDMNKVLDAAKRTLQVDPNNLAALAISTYVEDQQAAAKTTPAEQVAVLDDAAKLAQQGLNATKPPAMSDADFQKQKAATAPIFHDALAADAMAKKDYNTAITEYKAALQAYPADQNAQGPALNDTFQLGQAYTQKEPKDLVNGVWYISRAAAYAPPQVADQLNKAAQYWYKKYHGSLDGYEAVQAQAKQSLNPPDNFTIVAAPPPPSPADQAHQAIVSTPDLKTLALGDKEFILANGSKEDADKVWDTVKGVTTKVPGLVIEATPAQIKLAVSDDNQASKTADFTINMKTPLTTVPAIGSKAEYVGTFDSYTQNPPMIIMKDGGPPTAQKAPAKRTAPTRRKPPAK
jgi:hypothetical protein